MPSPGLPADVDPRGFPTAREFADRWFLLQGENARATYSVRVVLNGDRRNNARYRFAWQNIILSKLIKAVVRDEIVAA